MSTIDRRVALLEQADAPAATRPADEPIGQFVNRMCVAIHGVRDDAGPDEWHRVIQPWLSAMTCAESEELLDAIKAIRQKRSAALADKDGSNP